MASNALPEEQGALLRTIAAPFMKSGEPPSFGYLVAKMDEQDMDARKIFRSLPRIPDIDSIIGRASYGFTTPATEPVQNGARIGLTIAAGLVIPDIKKEFGEPFLLVLHQMIKIFQEAPTTPEIGKNVWIGANTVILRGTKIGDNCVIGAGTIVKGDFPENSIIVQNREPKVKFY